MSAAQLVLVWSAPVTLLMPGAPAGVISWPLTVPILLIPA